MSEPGIVSLFADLEAVFAPPRLRWYVFGAQAVMFYGRPRLTADVDVTVEAGGLGAAELTRLLGAKPFSLRFEPSAAFLASTRLLPVVHAPTEMPIDLLLAGDGLEREFLARARMLPLGTLSVPVVSPEDLVAMKVFAGRRKDLDDVRGILDEQGALLDLNRVRDVLDRLQEVSGTRLLPRLARLLRAAGQH